MAQFDVYRNPGRNRDAIPYVIVLQSRRFDGHARRLVAPLVAAGAAGASGYPEIAPRFEIEGNPVILDPLQIQTVPAAALGAPVASLAEDRHSSRIVSAIDVALSTSHG